MDEEVKLTPQEKRKSGLRHFFLRLAVSMISAICIGIGASYVTTMLRLENFDTRISQVEKKVIDEKLVERTVSLETAILRHEQALDRDFERHEKLVYELSHKTDDQEKRLTRLETLVSETQRLLGEIATDVKQLLRARR